MRYRLLLLAILAIAATFVTTWGSAAAASTRNHSATGQAGARYSLGRAMPIPPRHRPAAASRRRQANAGDLLFSGSRLRDFAQIQAAPDAIAETSGPAIAGGAGFKMTVDDGDVYPLTPTENPRAQALSPAIVDRGDELWLKTSFMIPSDMPAVSGWMALVSIYGPPFQGSSPWQIGIRGSELLWQRNATYDYDVPWRMPLVRGKWTTVLLHERFDTDGWVEMWIDGTHVAFAGGAKRLAMQTVDSSNGSGPNSAKIMHYRQAGMFDSATLFFGPLLIGRTRTAVES
jgi:hypothetical protein